MSLRTFLLRFGLGLFLCLLVPGSEWTYARSLPAVSKHKSKVHHSTRKAGTRTKVVKRHRTKKKSVAVAPKRMRKKAVRGRAQHRPAVIAKRRVAPSSRVPRRKAEAPVTWYCIEGSISTTVYKAFKGYSAYGAIGKEFMKALNGEVDFPEDVRKGDSFRILLSRRGKKGPAKLAAVEFNGAITGRIKAYYFASAEHGISGWFTSDEMKNKRIVPSPYWVLRVSSPYGMRKHPISGRRRMHEGTDFAAAVGTPVLAVDAGTVTMAGYRGGYGKLVEIRHGSTTTRYGHLSSILVKPGRKVARGTLIGKVGSTGISTGPHLHFEYLRRGRHVNPDLLEISPLGEFSQDLQVAYKAEVRRLNQAWTIASRVPSSERKALASSKR